MYGLVSPLNYFPAQVHTKLLVFPASAEEDQNNRGKSVRLLWHDPAPIGNNYPYPYPYTVEYILTIFTNILLEYLVTNPLH